MRSFCAPKKTALNLGRLKLQEPLKNARCNFLDVSLIWLILFQLMKVSTLSLLSLALTAGLALNAAPEESPLAKATTAFIESLNESQKKAALFPFEDEERENWHYVPLDREGARIDSLDESQSKLLQTLLLESLSAEGHATSKDVIQLENLLYERSNKADLRDPGKYTVAIFGKPSSDKPWGWRFEGHHLSFNFTVASDKVTLATPFFFGTNPAEVRKGELKGLRPLGKIEDSARELALAIHAEGKPIRFTEKPPKEIFTRQDRTSKAFPKKGVSYVELSKEHQTALIKLVSLIAASQKPEFIAFKPVDLEKGQFAWGGNFEKGTGHYFCVQTEEFLIEYVNTQNKANHAHLVWRDFKNDFGRDILKEHLEHEH